MTEWGTGYSQAKALAGRGPDRWFVSGAVRTGEFMYGYAATSAEAEQLAAGFRDDGYRQVVVTDPEGVGARPELMALADEYVRAARVAAGVKARLRAALVLAVTEGGVSEAESARLAGVDRMTARKWLGKG